MDKYIQKPKVVVSVETKKKLDELLEVKGDTYDTIILRLIERK